MQKENKNQKTNNWYKQHIKELSESKYHFKELTENDIQKFNFEDIAFYMESEPGAMGEMGGIEIVLENKKFYHTNSVERWKIVKKLFKKFPQIENIKMCLGFAYDLPLGFEYFNLGMGNYLFIKQEYYKYINEKTKELNNLKYLYKTWKDYVLEILK